MSTEALFSTPSLAHETRSPHPAVQEIRLAAGQWQFVSLPSKGSTWVWDPRPGTYYIKWWEGPRRRRESARPKSVRNALTGSDFVGWGRQKTAQDHGGGWKQAGCDPGGLGTRSP